MTPAEPPIATADLPGAGGRIGPEPEDFQVDEVGAFAPSGGGEHLWVRVQKRGLNTEDAIRAVARAAGVRERDVGSAGMKDRHAVTTQWLSLVTTSDPAGWQLPEGVSVLESTRHDKKLRTGQLAGNRFRVRLTEVPAGGAERAAAICERLRAAGLANYFGSQRFGRGGENLARALDWLRGGAVLRGKRGRFYQKLHPSVIQSEIFDRYLTARAELGLGRLLAGEVVRLDGSGSVFVVEEPERELPRLRSGDIHLTGPMIGQKTRAARGEPLELEQRITAELGLDETLLSLLARHAPGTRRDLVVPLAELELRPRGADQLELAFFLPAGSYATQLVRELTRGPWISTPKPR